MRKAVIFFVAWVVASGGVMAPSMARTPSQSITLARHTAGDRANVVLARDTANSIIDDVRLFRVRPDGVVEEVRTIGSSKAETQTEDLLPPTSGPPPPVFAFTNVPTSADDYYFVSLITCTSPAAPTVVPVSQPTRGALSSTVVPYTITSGYPCAGATVPLTVLEYNWTYLKKLKQPATDTFSATWTFANGFTPTYSYTATRIPIVNSTYAQSPSYDPSIVWWFGVDGAGNAVSPACCYNTTVSLYPYVGTNTMPQTSIWTITKGADLAGFQVPGTTNIVSTVTLPLGQQAMVVGRKGSPSGDGVGSVQLTVTQSIAPGSPSQAYDMEVKQPMSLKDTGVSLCQNWDGTPAGSPDYLCDKSYYVFDNDGVAMPRSVAQSEDFTGPSGPPVLPCSAWISGGFCPDYIGENWSVNLQPCGFGQMECSYSSVSTYKGKPAAVYTDYMGVNGYVNPNFIPLPVPPENFTPVLHWPGDFRIGSLSPGAGVIVQTQGWQADLGYATHVQTTSPPAGN